MAASPWPVIHVERGALADDLSGLSDAQGQMDDLATGPRWYRLAPRGS